MILISLPQADEHFGRLRAWGLTFVRLLVTWEAVEHKGPGIYDEEYLDYLLQIVRKVDDRVTRNSCAGACFALLSTSCSRLRHLRLLLMSHGQEATHA